MRVSAAHPLLRTKPCSVLKKSLTSPCRKQADNPTARPFRMNRGPLSRRNATVLASGIFEKGCRSRRCSVRSTGYRTEWEKFSIPIEVVLHSSIEGPRSPAHGRAAVLSTCQINAMVCMVNQVEMVTALRQELSIRQLAKEKPSAVISDHNCRPCSSRHCTADHLPTARFTRHRARGVVICAGMPAACGRSGVTSRAKWFQPDYSAPRMLDLILTEIASSPAHGR